MIEMPALSDDEQRICSLVSDKHPYEELRDVIVETCLHQRDQTVRWVVELLRKDSVMFPANINHPEREQSYVGIPLRIWQELEKLAEGK